VEGFFFHNNLEFSSSVPIVSLTLEQIALL
jgi:hypothetical protein